MKTLTSIELAQNCMAALDDVNASADGVVITKDGRPVARLLPLAGVRTVLTGGDIIREYKDKIKINGDVFSTGVRWDAEFGHSYHPVRNQSDADSEGASRD